MHGGKGKRSHCFRFPVFGVRYQSFSGLLGAATFVWFILSFTSFSFCCSAFNSCSTLCWDNLDCSLGFSFCFSSFFCCFFSFCFFSSSCFFLSSRNAFSRFSLVALSSGFILSAFFQASILSSNLCCLEKATPLL